MTVLQNGDSISLQDKRVVPFRAWHYEWLAARSVPGEGYTMTLDSGTLAQLERANSWTGVVDGEPLVCAGVMTQWPGRHMAWAYLAQDTGPHMLWITRQVKRVLKDVQGRIEFTVRKDFEAGHAWARLLGFKVETPCMEKYGPLGEDHTAYVRLN